MLHPKPPATAAAGASANPRRHARGMPASGEGSLNEGRVYTYCRAESYFASQGWCHKLFEYRSSIMTSY